MFFEDNLLPEYQPSKNYFETSAPNIKHHRYIGNMEHHTSNKWLRLKQLDSHLSNEYNLAKRLRGNIKQILNYFDLNDKIKNFILNDVEKKKPQKLKDVILFIFQSICRNNLPITTSEYRAIIKKEFNLNRKFLSKINPDIPRDYTWFINRVLSNVNLPLEYYHKVFLKVKENFDKLQKKIKGNPTTLISTLCYLSYKKINLAGKMPSYEDFLFTGASYRLYRIRFRELGITLPNNNKKIINNQYFQTYYQENKEMYTKHRQRYYNKHKEEVKNHQKQYYEEHKDERAEYNKQYREKHKEEMKNYFKIYYQKNKEKILKKNREYRKKNKENILEWNKEYKKINTDKVKQYNKTYYQKKINK